MFVGGQLDNSVKVYSLPRLKLAGSSSARHIDIVTCLALDEGGGSVGGGGTALLMTGSRDTPCAIWEVSPTGALKSVQVITKIIIIHLQLTLTFIELSLIEFYLRFM